MAFAPLLARESVNFHFIPCAKTQSLYVLDKPLMFSRFEVVTVPIEQIDIVTARSNITNISSCVATGLSSGDARAARTVYLRGDSPCILLKSMSEFMGEQTTTRTGCGLKLLFSKHNVLPQRVCSRLERICGVGGT